MKIWKALPIAAAVCGFSFCAAFASVAPEPKAEEPVISNIEEIPAGTLAMPIAAPQKSDAPLSEEAQKLSQPDVPQAEFSAATPAAESASPTTVPDTPQTTEILAASEQSPLNGLMDTLSALNTAIVSLGRITASGDRVVLDAECREIFANLKIGNPEYDPEIVDLYTRLFELLSAHRLTEEELRIVSRIYDARQRRALNAAFSSLKMRDLDIFFATLFSRGANGYFGYSDIMADVRAAISWQLDDETHEELKGFQRELLVAGDALQKKYGLPENLRLTQEEVDYFEQVIAQTDDEKALEMYPVLQSAFEYYSPFWFYWARAAASSDVELTLSLLDKFDSLCRPVLLRDPFIAEATKMRIVHEEWTSSERLIELLLRFKENMDEHDWLDNLFYGTVTWAAGDREGGITAVRNNLLQKIETRISGVVLEVLESEKFDAEKLRTAFLNATEGEKHDSPDRVVLSAWLAGNDVAAESGAQQMMGENSPIPYLIAWQLLRKSDKVLAASFEARHAELASRDASAYAAVFSDVNSAAGKGNARAQWLLGLMYESGWGVACDVSSAAKWYKAAAGQGHSAAQTAYAAMCERGTGTKKDVKEAVKWYSRAARSGDERAQFELGRMYRAGTGVKRDIAAAAQNFTESAKAGYPPAQAILGELYRKGAGVPKDLFESYRWSWLAKLNGEKSAQANLNALEGRGKRSKLDPMALELAKAQAQKMYDEMHGKQ